jgi:tetratricopeptide (TPR) repeat protein
VKILEGQGWTVFWDDKIRGGDYFREKILDELKTARCVVAVWSKHSVGSRWVRTEAEKAINKGNLVPIKIDNSETPFGFEECEEIRFTHWPPSSRDEKLNKLLDSISNIIKKPIREIEPRAGREEISFDKLNTVSRNELNGLMKSYQEMLNRDPEDGESCFRLAMCYLHVRIFEKASEYFQRAAQLLLNDSDAYYYFGLSLLSGRRPKTLSLKEVRFIEENLNIAMDLDDNQGKYYYLAAILKYDYYLENGLRIDSPSPDDLFIIAKQKKHDQGEIERLLNSITLRDEELIAHICNG